MSFLFFFQNTSGALVPTDRELSQDMAAAIIEDVVRPFFLFEGIFASSTLRLWDGNLDLLWDSVTWLGNGWFKGFSDVKEDNESNSKGLDILLSGVPSTLVSLILSEQNHACRGKLYLGLFDDTYTIIDDPYLLFEGSLSSPKINDSSDSCEVTLSYEDDLVILQNNKESRYNHESQQRFFPGDLGFEFVASIQNWSGFWGNKEKPKTQKQTKKPSRQKNKSKKR